MFADPDRLRRLAERHAKASDEAVYLRLAADEIEVLRDLVNIIDQHLPIEPQSLWQGGSRCDEVYRRTAGMVRPVGPRPPAPSGREAQG